MGRKLKKNTMMLTDKDTLCNRYIRRKINQYKKKKALLLRSDAPIKGVKIRRWFHPVLMKILQIKSILSGLTYEFVSEERNVPKDKIVIYAITHIGKFDYEMLIEACDIFAYVFMGDWELMYAVVDDYFLRAKGVLWVDTADKEDRHNSFRFMKKLLKQGTSMIIFPEGIWNLTENLPMMKIFPGAVQAAKECNVPIVPIAIEQQNKHFLINVGKELDFSDVEESEAVRILRDTLASLKWEIWERLPREKRKNIPEGYHEKFVQERLAEYAGFTKELIEGRMYRDKMDGELMAIRKDLEGLKKRDI